MDPAAHGAENPLVNMATRVEDDKLAPSDHASEDISGLPEGPDQDPWFKRHWRKVVGIGAGAVAGVALIATLGGGPSGPEASDSPGGGGIDFTDEFGNGFRLEPEQIDYIDNETGYIYLNDGSIYDLEGNLVSGSTDEPTPEADTTPETSADPEVSDPVEIDDPLPQVERSDFLPAYATPAVIEQNEDHQISTGVTSVFNRSVAIFREAVLSGDMSIAYDAVANSEEFPDRQQKIYDDLISFLQVPMQECVDSGATCTWDNFNVDADPSKPYQQYTTNSDGNFAQLYDYLRLRGGPELDAPVIWEGYVAFQAENNDPTDPFGWRILKLEPFTP
jgi:hypothetical protein